MVAPNVIERAIGVLVKEASPERIILFGSQARGEARPDSDVDFLVVVGNSAENRFRTATRLRRSLSPLKVPVDIVVHDSDTIREWGEVPGTLVYTMLHEGKVVYEKP
jgi:predicted nucleotidyltransferase